MARTSAEYWTSILLNNLMSDQEESLKLYNIAEINRKKPKDIQCYLPRIRRHSSFVSTIYHHSLRQAPDRTSDHVHQRAPMRPTASHILNRNTLICFNVIIRQSTAMRGISRKNQNELRLLCGCSKVHFHSSLLRIEVVLQEMGKRRYLNLSGGPFREGDEPKNKQNKKEESIGRKNEDDPTNKEEQEEEEVEIEQRELSQCAERKELGPCETPRRKFMKKKHRKFDSGISFRCNSQFGGFSRTNAAPHYQYERGKGTERYRTRRPNEPNEVLKVIWLDKSVPLPNAQHGRRSPEEDNSGAEENGIFEGGLITPPDSESDGQQLVDGFRDEWDVDESPDLNMTDEEFDEYCEKMCERVITLMERIALMNDCCLRESSPSSLRSTQCGALEANSDHQYNLDPEIYSRKVFVGGLPIGIKEGDLIEIFARFGPLMVDWPRKNEKKRCRKPKGCAFLIFNLEVSVRKLVENCTSKGEKLFFFIHSPADRETVKLQIRPWRLEDSDYSVDVNAPINLHLVVFVGGVPLEIRAVDLAHIMDRLFGNVAYAGIDTDFKYKYPRGAGRVAFTNYSSYIKAIKEQYVQLSHGDIETTVEIKPYVLDGQLCEKCIDEKNGGKYAPFFCPHLDCLQYYCESCWTWMHSTPLRKHHKPLIRETYSTTY